MRHGSGSEYKKWRTNTAYHNIKAMNRKKMRVRFHHTRQEMLDKLQGTIIQKEMQGKAWTLVDKLIEGKPPLKEWAGEKLDYKVQFSMMTSTTHAVKAHRDGDDIAPQFSICLGKYTGGELLTWDENRGKDKDPHLSTDVKNKLVKFDGRLKHAVAALGGCGSYCINIAFYKHYDTSIVSMIKTLIARSRSFLQHAARLATGASVYNDCEGDNGSNFLKTM